MSKMKMADGSTVLRRNRPGTKAKDFCRWPDEPFEEMDSTLAVQQYIQQLIRHNPANIDLILKMPENQDEGVWKYEHLRQFCMELNGLAVRLQGECHPETCTQMTATEQWIFLCAAHKTPKECPAIDYTRHTLDGAACLLNSNKYFPSRVSIKESSVAKLGSVCRRVYRIFSHAYFHHRSIFDEFENETCLCKRFTQFVTKYNLMSKDNLIVPILEDDAAPGESEANQFPPVKSSVVRPSIPAWQKTSISQDSDADSDPDRKAEDLLEVGSGSGSSEHEHNAKNSDSSLDIISFSSKDSDFRRHKKGDDDDDDDEKE